MSRRKSIYAKGFTHVNPIPAACRIGNLLLSGVITGKNSETGKMGATLEEQCAYMFEHIREIVEAGGGTVDDIAKITVWLRDPSDRKILNQAWIKMFPDEASRPARHTQAGNAGDETLIRCDFIAVIDTLRS